MATPSVPSVAFMAPPASNWIAVSPSQYAWEQEALDFIYEKFPKNPDYTAWSNFEFFAVDGSMNEVDLLVASPWGVFLVEIKSRPGRLTGDQATWVWIDSDGRRRTTENPLLLANRKCKRLKELVGRQKAMRGKDVPFIQALVFCSATEFELQLAVDARNFVCVRDHPDGNRPGIRAALFQRKGPGLRTATERLVDGPTLKAFAQAMAQAGLRRQVRKVSDFVLDRLRYESPTAVFQDWEAHHTTNESVRRLVRLYLTGNSAAKEDREAVTEAGRREFHTLEKLNHPGILKALVPAESELGQAIVFEFDPSSQRLDHYLAEHGAQLDAGARLDLLRQVSDAIRYAHDKRVIHRALSPQSIFVLVGKGGVPRVQIYNWHTGTRLVDGSFSGLTSLTGTLHAAQLLEDPARAYLAPETLIPGEEPSESMDVFSLGALAYFLFSGQPPAADAADLEAKLKVSPTRSLDLREICDGVSESIATMVRESTAARVVERCSLDDFLAHHEFILDELTRPENQVLDPREADSGDTLDNGFKVERRLGRGSSAIALLVQKGDTRCVIKIARETTSNRRLEEEFKILQRLTSQNIVKSYDTYVLHGLTAFTVELAGERTLARMLKEDGPPDLELLQRYGEQLIRAVEYLDEQGIFHRDIKPENIGIGTSATKAANRLRLFDFSLGSAAPTDLKVGTPEYLDPFLEDRKARRYDLSAEIYAVGMTLHEVATGFRPKWEGGQPRLTNVPITLRSELFDPNLRDQFNAFFRTALHRDYRERFDNTREMLRKWNAIFETVDRPTTQTEHEAETDGIEPISDELLATLTPSSQVSDLALSTRLMNFLERIGVHTVAELLGFKFGRFDKFRGVGRKTRVEMINVSHRLRERFPETSADQGGPASQVQEAPFALGLETLDVLGQHALLVKKGKVGATEASIIHPFLGWKLAPGADPLSWPSQSDLVEVCAVTRQRIGQVVTAFRERWAKSALLSGLRDAISEILRSKSGVMTHQELVTQALSARGSLAEEPQRTQFASAAVRAAVEAERVCDTPRFEEFRSGDKIFIALHPELRAYAVALGREADRLAGLDPLPSPPRVLEELRAIEFPAEVPELSPPAEGRLRQLAVAAAATADVSSRAEIYPIGMDARRAFALARNAMFGDELSIAEIDRRVRARFPRCGPLPTRPELDDFLADSHDWYPLVGSEGAYRPKQQETHTPSPSYSLGTRQRTKVTLQPAAVADPAIAEAANLEARLRHSLAEGGYLILTVDPSFLEEARRELCRRFDLDACDLDEIFLEELRAEADRVGANWEVVLAADGAPRDSTDWANLQRLVERALPSIERRLRTSPKTCLALHPGLLARYGQMHLVAGLAADVGHPGGPAGLWLLAPENGQHALPTLNGAPIPITNAAQHTRLTSVWLRNEHRAAASSQ